MKILAIAAMVLMSSLAGCGDSTPEKYELVVTLDNEMTAEERGAVELRTALDLSLSEASRILAVCTGPQICGLEIEMRHVESLVRATLPHVVTSVARITDSSGSAQAVTSRLWLSG